MPTQIHGFNLSKLSTGPTHYNLEKNRVNSTMHTINYMKQMQNKHAANIKHARALQNKYIQQEKERKRKEEDYEVSQLFPDIEEIQNRPRRGGKRTRRHRIRKHRTRKH